MRFILLILILLPLALPAEAQVVVPGGVSVTFNKCPTGSFLDGSFTNNVANCVAAPAGGGTGGSTTVTGGTCISVVGSPTTGYTISEALLPSIEPAGRPIVAADGCKLLIYIGAVPGTFTFPVPGAVGSPPVLCLKAANVGPLILAPAASFYGGPVTLNKDQDECASNDGAGKWVLWTGVSPTVPNPNPFQ